MPYEHIIDTIFWQIIANNYSDAELEKLQQAGWELANN